MNLNQLALSILVTYTSCSAVFAQSLEHDHPHKKTEVTSEKVIKQAKKKPTEKSLGPQGGMLQKLESLQIESVIQETGISIFAYDLQTKTLNLSKARGLITLKIDGQPKRFRYDLFPVISKDQPANSLKVYVDLSKYSSRRVAINGQIVGLPAAGKKPLKFSLQTSFPLSADQKLAAAIAAQKICPVSKQPLGSMGDPIGVKIGDQTIYVCCAGCTKALQGNPKKFLANLKQPTKPQVVKADTSDAKYVAAQKLCPVMDEPLDAIGRPLQNGCDGQSCLSLLSWLR